MDGMCGIENDERKRRGDLGVTRRTIRKLSCSYTERIPTTRGTRKTDLGRRGK